MAQIALVATDAWYVWNFRAATIRRLIKEGHAITVLCGNRSYFGHLKRLGVLVVYVPLDGRRISALREVWSLICLARALFFHRPNIVLSFNPKGNLYTGIVRHILRFGWIANISGLGVLGEAVGLRSLALNAMFRLAFRNVDHVFFQNAADLGSWAAAAIVPANRSSRQYGSGLDLSEFAPVEAPFEPIKVVCIARLIEKKGVREFISLAEMLHTRLPEVRFLLAGAVVPVDEGGVPKEVIEAAEAAGHIQFLGMLDDVRPILARRTVGCLLTRYKEGIPRSMIEFLATGRPILVSEFNGVEDLVPKAGNGQIVDVRSSDWLVKAADFIQKCALEPLHYNALCAESRRLAELHFDGNVGDKEYLNHIKALLR